MTANKVKFGLKNVYYAVATTANNVMTYGTPVAIPGAVNLTLSPEGESGAFYADNQKYYIYSNNNGYSGSLEIALVPDSFRVDVLGDTIDSNGALIENANASSKDFALMFEFTGDQSGDRHVLFNCSANRSSLESGTKAESVEVKTESFDFVASAAYDSGNVKARVKSGDTGYSTFFSAVYVENAVLNTLDTTSYTFTKAAPLDKVIDVTSTSGTNKVKDVKFNGVSIGGANMTYTGVDATILKTYLGTLVNGTYAVTVEFVQGNAVTATITVGA